MSTPSKDEIWVGFVKRVFTTSSDLQSAARRLHRGHDLIFGERIVPLYIKKPQASDVSDRSKKAMWAACLKCAEHSCDHVDDVASRLIRAHNIIFNKKKTES